MKDGCTLAASSPTKSNSSVAQEPLDPQDSQLGGGGVQPA